LSSWTISSTCTTHVDWRRHGHHDQGWSADAHYNGGLWFVEHDLPAWQPCGDGATAPGEQQFSFYRVDATTLTGKDKTTGPSGSCGVSALLTIEMPFKTHKMGDGAPADSGRRMSLQVFGAAPLAARSSCRKAWPSGVTYWPVPRLY